MLHLEGLSGHVSIDRNAIPAQTLLTIPLHRYCQGSHHPHRIRILQLLYMLHIHHCPNHHQHGYGLLDKLGILPTRVLVVLMFRLGNYVCHKLTIPSFHPPEHFHIAIRNFFPKLDVLET
jgi:hypothetical protein